MIFYWLKMGSGKWNQKPVVKNCRTIQNIKGVVMVEASLQVKLPTIWTDEKQRREESERREE